ncbi:hypothetical protein [Burkholderia sp. AU45388]|uniref:hypothetical protein n=1 Tax=Burkholderia sp. AU45388 TaxID=3059206 RepID=UPI00265075A8|nr:hypothetical protein [Burkholderia sp. AU45388]MDN7431391.1 hypothetical protein [Burkholderia sp. AU45388]
MHVTMKVARKRAGGRRRAYVLERDVLAGVARTLTCDAVTVVRVSFEDGDTFDRLVEVALTAEQHRCTSETELWAPVAGERWRW